MIDIVPIKKRVETGELFISDLVDADIAFGNALVAVVHGLREASTHPRHEPFAKFTAKPSNAKVLVSTEVEPKAFLNRLRAKLVKPDSDRENKAALPVVYFHRVQGLTMGLAGDHKVIKSYANIVDENGLEVAEVDEIPVTVTYQVYMLAWDQVSLNKLAAGIFCGFATKGRSHTFTTDLLGLKLDNRLITSPAQDFASGDISLPSTEDRLLAYDLSVEVQTQLYQARIVNTSTVSYEIQEGKRLYSELEL
ncbi:MAG: hypothetical protein ACRCXH_08180 [Shewanella sp.]|uniref:hypothetical protein n=1 Tax=Shewanella sp. TaxID=50422 RepID=UPI003F324E30